MIKAVLSTLTLISGVYGAADGEPTTSWSLLSNTKEIKCTPDSHTISTVQISTSFVSILPRNSKPVSLQIVFKEEEKAKAYHDSFKEQCASEFLTYGISLQAQKDYLPIKISQNKTSVSVIVNLNNLFTLEKAINLADLRVDDKNALKEKIGKLRT